jgi:type I restriction enzyme S subunit
MPKKKLAIGEIAYSESSNVSQQSLTIMPEGNFPVFGAEGIIKKIQQFEQKDPYIGIIKDGAGVGRSYLLPGESTIIGTLNYIKPKKGIDLNYLYQAFKSLNFTKYIVGSGIPHIYFKDYKVLEIPLPEYETQKKLGSFLSAIDRLIEKQKEKVNRIKYLKKGYLQKMFPADGEEEPELRFLMFKGKWSLTKFGNKVMIRRGLTYNPEDVGLKGVRVLRSSNINEDKFVIKDNDVFVDPSAANIDYVNNGDILITSANGSERLVGKHAIVNGLEERSSVHGGFMLLASFKFPNFLNASMSSNWYDRFIKVYVSGGNGSIGNLSKSHLDNMNVLFPNESEQIKIGNFFNQLDTLIADEEAAIERYESLKKGYLQKIFAD